MARRINQLIKSITAFVRFHFLSYSLFSIYCLYLLFNSNFHIHHSLFFFIICITPFFIRHFFFIFHSLCVCLLFSLSSLFSLTFYCLLSRFVDLFFFVLFIIIFNSWVFFLCFFFLIFFHFSFEWNRSLYNIFLSHAILYYLNKFVFQISNKHFSSFLTFSVLFYLFLLQPVILHSFCICSDFLYNWFLLRVRCILSFGLSFTLLSLSLLQHFSLLLLIP